MKATYTYGEKKVIISNGIVAYSDTTLATVGQKANTKSLVACGWKKATKPTTYYSHGQAHANRFLK